VRTDSWRTSIAATMNRRAFVSGAALLLNRRTAKTLGLAIPLSLLLRADQVME
jgi:hypothetical protein